MKPLTKYYLKLEDMNNLYPGTQGLAMAKDKVALTSVPAGDYHEKIM